MARNLSRTGSLKGRSVPENLREGLKRLEAEPEASAPFRTETVSLGRCLVGDLEKVAEALAIADGEVRDGASS